MGEKRKKCWVCCCSIHQFFLSAFVSFSLSFNKTITIGSTPFNKMDSDVMYMKQIHYCAYFGEWWKDDSKRCGKKFQNSWSSSIASLKKFYFLTGLECKISFEAPFMNFNIPLYFRLKLELETLFPLCHHGSCIFPLNFFKVKWFENIY